MSTPIKVMILILIILFVGLFFVKGPSGQPVLKAVDFIPDLPAFDGTPAGTTQLYRWQDEHGQWHYSEEATESTEAVVVEDDASVTRFTKPVKKTSVNDWF